MSDGFPIPFDPGSIQAGLHYFDMVGVFVFAMAGGLTAVQKRFDLFGVCVLGCVSAVGGGTIRDILTGRAPPLFLRDETYLYIALAGSLLAFAFGVRLLRINKLMVVLDTLGLALFAASGALLGVHMGLGPLGVSFVGMLSGAGGGIIRDLLLAQVPEIMYRNDQLYATAAALGAFSVYYLNPHFAEWQTTFISAGITVLARWVSRRGWVKLPVRRLPQHADDGG